MSLIAVAGSISGICYSAVMCPFEMVKCNTQRSRQSLKEVFHQILARRGPAGLYRGLGACFCRDISQSIAYYTSAEYFNRSTQMQKTFGAGTAFCSGMLTGIFHCSVELPFDTIRTRLQTGSELSYRQLMRSMFSAGMASGM